MESPFERTFSSAFRIDSVLLQWYGVKFGLEEAERLNCSQIGGPLQDDAVAFIQEYLAQEIEALLRAIGDQDLGGFYLHAPPGIPLCDHLSQGKVTFRCAVL